MRLRQSENKLFRSAIEKSGLEPPEFEFVKKRGWLNILYKREKSGFKFHRKSRKKLEGNTWSSVDQYFVSLEGHPIEFDTINDVMDVFAAWLNRLK